MFHTARKLSKHNTNNVISLKELKSKDFRLYRLYLSNKSRLTDILLLDYGIYIMDDRTSRKSVVPLYIKYHYDNKVNLTEFRNNHWTVYKYLCALGDPAAVLESWGIEVGYSTWKQEKELTEILSEVTDTENNIKKIRKPLYSKFYYRASLHNLTVAQYLDTQGFKFKGRKE